MDARGVVAVQTQMALIDMCHDAAKEFGASKVKPKPSDECYTPPEVYQVVLDYCVERYNIDPANVIRPFKPGGDYTAEDYAGKVVVDNPPFSILAEIKAFYLERGVPFFLFAPTLTLLSSPNYVSKLCHICIGAKVTYANDVVVQTSFVTNMESGTIIRTDPELTRAIEDSQIADDNSMPKYEYPVNVVSAARLWKLNRHGVTFSVRDKDCITIPALDAQRAADKSIFGGGLLLNSHAAAEHAAAEHAAAEHAAAKAANSTIWPLSEREKAMVAYMDERGNK